MHREHGFFHFTGIAHASKQYLALGEINDNNAIGVGAIALRVTFETSDVENIPFGLSAGIIGLGADKHIAPKQRLPSGFCCDFHGQVVIAVLAHMKVGNEFLTNLQM